MKYCCTNLEVSTERKEIVYDKPSGCFWFYFKRDYEDSYGLYRLGYCPFCGVKLPKDRKGIDENGNDPYTDALEEAVGKEYCDIKEDEIPEEFKTDEWWRKRGL